MFQRLDRRQLRRLAVASLVLLCVASGPILAKFNNPDLRLEFVPQQAVASPQANLSAAMLGQPVSLRVEEGRPGKDLSLIGSRTDDADRRHELRATNDVAPFVERSLTRLFEDWGMDVAGDAERVLALKLRSLDVTEVNQAVGATYKGRARLEAELRDRSGRVLWSGASMGAATRYGKKFSNPNCNEVLSDALWEAAADLLSGRSLQAAWEGKGAAKATAVAAAGGPRAALTPAELLTELRSLMAERFEHATLLDYVARQRLSTGLTAADLGDWKRAGVPEEVVRAALDLPVESDE